MTSIPTFQVDAFTSEPFRGNPAAVCLPAEPLDDDTMQAIAAEMNLSETAFVEPRDGGAAFGLRWFTPACEVPLCGHATLASAQVLWETGVLPTAAAAEFVTQQSGTLGARRNDAWIELDFPALVCEDVVAPASVTSALGPVVPKRVVEVPRETYGQSCFMAELDSEQAVRELAPDLDALRAPHAPGLIVTARADADTAGIDFVSRFFAPFVGVDEDPVTGSAHCALAPYWGAALSRTELTGFQASARGGVVGVRWTDDRVVLCGQAVTVLRGEIEL